MKPEQATRYRTERDPLPVERIKTTRRATTKPGRLSCASMLKKSVGVAALYNEERGFMGAAELAKKAIDTGKSVKEVVAEEG